MNNNSIINEMMKSKSFHELTNSINSCVKQGLSLYQIINILTHCNNMGLEFTDISQKENINPRISDDVKQACNITGIRKRKYSSIDLLNDNIHVKKAKRNEYNYSCAKVLTFNDQIDQIDFVGNPIDSEEFFSDFISTNIL